MKLRWLLMAVALVALSAALDFLLLRENGEPELTYFPGFFALFGLLGAMAVIVISRLLGRFWLERDKEYYHVVEDDD